MRMIKKLFALLLAVLILCSAAGCADKSPVALSLDGFEYSEAMYSYWASSYKGNYIYSYSDVENSAEYWQSELKEGTTVAQYFDGITLDAVKTMLVTAKLFDENRLYFTDEEEASVDAYISDLIKERAEGSKNMMNTMLGEYGINVKILKKIYLEEEKGAKVFSCLFGEGGKMALSESDYESFYADNYVRFQMIYINNAYQYVTDAEGNRVTDDDGYYKTEDLGAEDKAVKDGNVKAVEDGLAAGGDFDSLYEQYSELKAYSGGYYYSAADSYSDMLYYRLIAAAEELEVGGWTKIESDTGTCIIKKLELDEGAWKKTENADFFGDKGETFKNLAQETAYREFIEGYFDKVVVNEDIIKKYTVANVTPAYFF